MPNVGTLTNMQQQLWDLDVLREAIEEMWFRPFMSVKGNSPILLKTDFRKTKGDKMTLELVMKLDGEGRDGDDEMEGYESDMDQYDMSFYVNQKRNAIRLKGRMDEQKSGIKLRSIARDRLGVWLAEIMEKEIFRKVSGQTTYTFSNTPTAPSTNRILYGGDASATTDLDTADKMTLALIFKAKAKAQMSTPKIQPIRIKGKDHFVMLINPEQKYDLTQDSNYATFQREAEVRGKGNPLINGADAVVDNVVIHVHNFVSTFDTWGTGADMHGARALLLGAQAVALGLGSGAGWNEKGFDFNNKWAICAGRIFGVQKTVFNSEDHGVIAIDTACTDL